MAAYEAALEVYSGHLPAMMGAASLALRTRLDREKLREWLEEIALRAEASAWWAWAQAERVEGRFGHEGRSTATCPTVSGGPSWPGRDSRAQV